MTEKYSFKNKAINYTRGLIAAGMIAASGCATPNCIKERRYLGLQGKLDNSTFTQVSANDKETMVRAGIKVDFNNVKELMGNTASATTAFGYGFIRPIYREFWVSSKPEKLEYSGLAPFTRLGYTFGRKAESAGELTRYLLFVLPFLNKSNGNETAPEGKIQPVQSASRTYEQPKEKPTEQTYVPPVNPPVNPSESDGDGRTTGY